MTATEGSFNNGTLVLPATVGVGKLSDRGGAGFIHDKIKLTVKGIVFSEEAAQVKPNAPPRPNKRVTEKFLKTMHLTKYKLNGACELKT